MPETAAKPPALTPVRLFVACLCALVLLLMVLGTLFGDFIVWAVSGTRFVLSPRSHKILGSLYPLGMIFMLIYSAQSAIYWKQKKFYLVLIGFAVLVVAPVPLAPTVAKVAVAVTAKGIGILWKLRLFPTALFCLIAFCKIKSLINFLQLFRLPLRTQEQRRIVISD